MRASRLLLAIACLGTAACGSGPSGFATEYNAELSELLAAISLDAPQAIGQPTSPISSGELTQDQLDVYLWVKARALQLAIEQNSAAPVLGKNGPMVRSAALDVDQDLAVSGANPLLSVEERAALHGIKCNEVIYLWMEDTVTATRDFVESVDKPEIIALLAQHAPAIQHNIDLVKRNADRLEVVNRYPISKFHATAQPKDT